jgi:hypothetical protein
LLTVPAQAQTSEPISAKDTVMVTVVPAGGENQFKLDIFVVNTGKVAGLPLPFKVTAESTKLFFDSVSYEEGRVAYFQGKFENPDSTGQTLLLGLIADLSGSKPSLAPGRGHACSIFFTAKKAVEADAITVEPVVIPPANRLEYNVYEGEQLLSVIPTFVRGEAKKKAADPEE